MSWHYTAEPKLDQGWEYSILIQPNLSVDSKDEYRCEGKMNTSKSPGGQLKTRAFEGILLEGAFSKKEWLFVRPGFRDGTPG